MQGVDWVLFTTIIILLLNATILVCLYFNYKSRMKIADVLRSIEQQLGKLAKEVKDR